MPYGYRKAGIKGQSHLVISDEPIPDLELSEVDVVRTIYRMCGVEKKSCQRIADYLNRAGIPSDSSAGKSAQTAGKRNRRMAPICRPSHLSRTYMRQHAYGKRTKSRSRKLIVREVPALVSEQIWQAAQHVLRSNRIMCRRNRKHPYLLRSLIKYRLCGLTFS